MEASVMPNKWDALITTIVLTLSGTVLAILHFVLGILPFDNVIEALLYAGFGYLFGKKVQGGHWWWGIILSLPAILLNLYRIYNAQTVGESLSIGLMLNLFLLPFAACLGIFLRNKYHHHKDSMVDKHFLND